MGLAAGATAPALRRPLAARSGPVAATPAPQQPLRVLAAARPAACARQAPRISSVAHITGCSSLLGGSGSRRQRQARRQQLGVAARARDPDAIDGNDEDSEAVNREPPSLFWRCFAALCYLVPWIDTITLGRHMYAHFRNLLLLYFVPGPMVRIYFSSQFAPLIIFFVMFLSVVKNNKLHHFVRFNAMQAIMLDIVVMLFHILRAYLPAEVKWSVLGSYFDMFAWTCCMSTILYSVFWTLRGYYADVAFVSESVYHQVELSEYA